MEELLGKLPLDIVNKIYLYLSHPIVDMIENDWNNMLAWEGYGDTWDEFVSIQLKRYKEKHRKKPKHCLIIGREIDYWKRHYMETIFYFHEDRPQTFSENYFERHMIDNSCDCCVKPWRDCQCWCSNCGDEYKCCKANCQDYVDM
jgi:hypothetical protein